MANKIKLLIFSFLLSVSYAQVLEVGDTIPSGLGAPVCANVDPLYMPNDSLYLDYYQGWRVTWIMFFTSWCPFCQDEAPLTQEVYEALQDSGLIVIGAGADWGQPDSCSEWVENYGITYPMLDGTDYEGTSWEDFGVSAIPHNVIIGADGVVKYSVAGYNENSVLEAVMNALEECGDACGCSDILGDLDGTYNSEGDPLINIMDLIKLADMVSLGSNLNPCFITKADFSDDGIVNIIDIFAFAAMLSEGQFDN